jgi:homogentisate 1,2-dioxygenase
MPSYHRLGTVPPKRHTQLRSPQGALYAEEVFGTEGFSGVYSILYHENLPPRVRQIEPLGGAEPPAWPEAIHRHYHLRSGGLPPAGDAVGGRVPLLFNDDVTISVAVPTRPRSGYYKNGDRDELVFVHEGRGELATPFGVLPFRPGDYIYIPRGTVQRWRLDEPAGRFLVIEAGGTIDTPARYRNKHGQLLEHAPFGERDIHRPERMARPSDKGDDDCTLTLKIDRDLYRHQLAAPPFDVVGWDGYLYPYTFNIHDFEPRSGRLHQPPPVHQTFEGPGFVVCSFVPRPLDWDPAAIPLPYYHSNLDSDEVLYYVAGSYGARKVEVGSLTFHPRGLSHGPSAGAVEASLDNPRQTDEVAVMIDTFRPLKLSAAAAVLDDPGYAESWNPR